MWLDRTELVSASTRTSDVHASPDTRAREGVPLQSLPVSPTPRRTLRRALPHRATGQDLVPEPPHEGEEGGSRHQRTQRARQEGACHAPPAARRRRRRRDVMGDVTGHDVTVSARRAVLLTLATSDASIDGSQRYRQLKCSDQKLQTMAALNEKNGRGWGGVSSSFLFLSKGNTVRKQV